MAGLPVISGSCGSTTTFTSSNPVLVSGTADCNGSIYELTYTATDACGRTASCSQLFTIENDGPSITCPANLNITCVNEIIEGIPTVISDCGLDTQIFVALP